MSEFLAMPAGLRHKMLKNSDYEGIMRKNEENGNETMLFHTTMHTDFDEETPCFPASLR